MHDLLYDNPPMDFGLGHASHGLGPEYQLTDDGQLVHVTNSFSGSAGSGAAAASGASPTSTLVGNAHGLEIDLFWDASVTSAHNWQAIESSVISAAEIFTGLFINHDRINVEVGFGEVAGFAMSPDSLGESLSNGYLVDDATLTSALSHADAGLVHDGLMSANAIKALDGAAGSFFLTAAEAKALGLVAPAAGLDGAVGFSNALPISYGRASPAAGQFDAIAIAAHELSEIMGRVGLEGATLVDNFGDVFTNVFTPLDIFRYTAPGAVDLAPTSAYFSLNDGANRILPFNNPNNGGDAADWATSRLTNGDAFNAFSPPGNESVTLPDLLVMAALGYQT